MTALADRLRGVLTPNPALRVAPAPSPRRADPDVSARIAEVLGGEWSTSRSHPFLRVERRYPGGYRHGHTPILDALPPESGVWPRLPLLTTRADHRAGLAGLDGGASRRLVFLDLETTGLAGGAGTYAFLVGCAWFEGAAFRIRQYFLSNFAAERALLEDVAELARGAAGVVTFNGKTFDVPLIETRFALHRLGSAFAELPHVDMLHVARRLWRSSDPEDAGDGHDETTGRGCRLSELEQTICGHERDGDVPGFEIPARYFNFVRSGDARPLEGVLEHNRLDLLSLALLTARAAQLLEDGHADTRDAREALGLGAIYERAGLSTAASDAYRHAALVGRGDPATKAEAWRAAAVLARRHRRFAEAAEAWQHALAVPRCPASIAREAVDALAVHHEHRKQDLTLARQFALQSLQYRSTPSRRDAAHHRLARLDRKLHQGTPLLDDNRQ